MSDTLARLSNLGDKVTTRTTSWLDLAQRAWGSEFHAPDHGIYEFSNGRKFDSTDMSLNGIYGVEVYDYLMQADNYPDMRTAITGEDGQDIQKV